MSNNPNDLVRDEVLRTLYDFHKNSKSPRSAARGIQEIQSKLREKGFKQQEVSHNLDYLLQKKWVVEIKVDRTFRTKQGTVRNAEQIKFKISDIGMDMLESASAFRRTVDQSTINITTINGVSVFGDGNKIVNTQYSDLARLLIDIRQAIEEATELDETKKLESLADVESLQSQLQKPIPNKNVVKYIWASLEHLSTVSGIVSLYQQAAILIKSLISS